MQITINTAEEISDLDRSILSSLIGGELVVPGVAETREEKPAKKTAPAKKTPAKKAEPKPEPEPMAEEPIEEPDEVDDAGDGEEQSDEELLKLAVDKATNMVKSGEAAKVREALESAGASRVRELNKDNVRDFFKALS